MKRKKERWVREGTSLPRETGQLVRLCIQTDAFASS